MRRLVPFVVAIVVACSDGEATTTSASPRSGIVDSIVRHEVAMARFVEGLPVAHALAGGAADADELIERFLNAVSLRDSTALRQMLVTRAEYGFLFYPTSIYSRKPYGLPPDVAWMLSSETSEKGARRMISRLGGKRMTLESYDCLKSEQQGDNNIRSGCAIRWSDESGARHIGALFRSLIIRDGHAKFLSFAGDY